MRCTARSASEPTSTGALPFAGGLPVPVRACLLFEVSGEAGAEEAGFLALVVLLAALCVVEISPPGAEVVCRAAVLVALD